MSTRERPGANTDDATATGRTAPASVDEGREALQRFANSDYPIAWAARALLELDDESGAAE